MSPVLSAAAVSFSPWLHAFRLRTLPLSLSSIFLGSFLAKKEGCFSNKILLLALLTTLLLQILSNLANDYGDSVSGVDARRSVGPARAVQSGAIAAAAMLRAIVVCALLCLVSGIALIAAAGLPLLKSLLFLGLGLLAIAAAIKYTVGKRPYGYIGLGDISVFIFFGVVGVCGTFYLFCHHWEAALLLPATAIGALSVGVLHLNNMRDRTEDAHSGKITMAVRLGAYRSKIYHTFLLLLPLMSMAVYVYHFNEPAQIQHWLFLLIIPLLFSNLNTVWHTQIPAVLNPLLKQLALGTFFFSLLAGISLNI